MRDVPQVLTDAWLSGGFVGAKRNVVRATIQRVHLHVTNTGGWSFASILFPQLDKPRELPNVRKLTWDRDTQTVSAQATLEMYNYRPLKIGQLPPGWPDSPRFGQPGYYTPRRGRSATAVDRWNQSPNEWRDWLAYDRVIRTYEGYGYDASVSPEKDPNLVLTGVWLVSFLDFGVGGGSGGSGYAPPGPSGSTDGVITLTMHDLGRMLTDDNIVFPPVIPARAFPLRFDPYHAERGRDLVTVSGTGWRHPSYSSDSGVPYFGTNGLNHGHRPTDALDNHDSTYWLSVGNDLPDADYSFEFIEGAPPSSTVTAVRARVWGGPYRVYLSIHTTDKGWLGHHSIPYNPSDPVSAPNGANVRYIDHASVDYEGEIHFKPKVSWTHVDKVRLTFTDLHNSGVGPYPYRAGVRNFQVCSDVVTRKQTHYHLGYREYTDIIKLVCASGGFFWPQPANKARQLLSDGTLETLVPGRADPALEVGARGRRRDIRASARGRVWGDFMNTGVGPITSITPDQIDKQPLYSVIQIVQQTIGNLFYIDETAGVIWRPPNYFKLGNYVLGAGYPGPQTHTSRGRSLLNGNSPGVGTLIPTTNGRTTHYVTIDENQTLVGLHAKLDGTNVREKVFVGNLDGAHGQGANGIAAIAKGRNPYPAGFRRVAGWLDQHFESKAECARMADMIVLQQYLTIWTDSITIPGNPQIQIDDQVLILEETTSETDFHYVQAIHSVNDMEGGAWTYNLDTNWLGTDPADPAKWIFDPHKFSSTTTTYLKGLGLL